MTRKLRSRTLAATAAAVAATALTGGFAFAAGGQGNDHAQLVSLEHTVHGLRRDLNALDNEAARVLKPAFAQIDKHTQALRTPNVVKAVATKTVAANGAVTVDAFCPPDYQVISGGYDQGAENGEVTRAVQIQKPKPGYEVSLFEQPGIANGNQDAQVTAVAYCAPIAIDRNGVPPKAVVFGAELPTK